MRKMHLAMSGVRFEDAVKRMIAAPPPPTSKKANRQNVPNSKPAKETGQKPAFGCGTDFFAMTSGLINTSLQRGAGAEKITRQPFQRFLPHTVPGFETVETVPLGFGSATPQ